MHFRIQHRTTYRYDKAVSLGPHLVRLCPAVHTRAEVDSYSLIVEPAGEIRWHYDPWNNKIATVSFPGNLETEELSFLVDANLRIQPVNPFDFFVDSRCENLPFEYPDTLPAELEPFLKKPVAGPLLSKFIDENKAKGLLIDYLVGVNKAVSDRISYSIREESGIQTSEYTLEYGVGSCRDMSLLLMEVLRSQGLAARFVSGYLIQKASEDESDSEDAEPGNTLDLHAWVEVFVPGAGWVGLDPTSGLLCSEVHVPLAATVSPEQAAPISGTASSASSSFEVFAEAAPIGGEREPDSPYDKRTWKEIKAAGSAIDSSLSTGGVRLTSGGEPTWTSIEHAGKPEWLTAALGRTKWEHSVKLLEIVSKKFGVGSLPVFGTGKVYPGEVEPRWALTLLWRKDGEPLWTNGELLSFEESSRDPSSLEADGLQKVEQSAAASKCELTSAEVSEFGRRLCERLNLKSNLVEGFEDPIPLAVREENLPVASTADSVDLETTAGRRILARSIDAHSEQEEHGGRKLSDCIGVAIPLRHDVNGWATGPWRFKRERMYLLPGDSPMGLRLPLDRILSNAEPVWERDPTGIDSNSPVGGNGHDSTSSANDSSGESQDSMAPSASGVMISVSLEDEIEAAQKGDEVSTVPATALCLQPAGSALGVFFPPLSSADEYLDLLRAVESVSADMSIKVRVEGYPPPVDPRLESLSITPDPGVLEVNMPVCASFEEYATALDSIAESAFDVGLGLEKYQMDGRIVGTGGGHHITLGGPNPLESPFIDRPEILSSLIRYLQNHPSLSYFFTGLFVGPFSQAPRIDEGRREMLYEMELALEQVSEERDGPSPPWLSDRLFRHLLVDISGSSHRAEICIDKLYNPNLASGRLGLVELRAFEMPPHHRMAAVEVLLMRALIAMFSKRPYERRLLSWGSDLHDRFMLPHFLWCDLADVTRELQRTGLPIELDWFRPFLASRFPVQGACSFEGVRIELRTAHEPWSVLGDGAGDTSTSRQVDSSTERLQVLIDGLSPDRFKVAVNGIELPLTMTDTPGQYVCGVRFRSWLPPHCLHPNIEPHSPLRFEVVDMWAERSLGACRYHVLHPEGKLYEEIPLTKTEATARRKARFKVGNHTPWPVSIRTVERDRDFPLTLDLRKFSL